MRGFGVCKSEIKHYGPSLTIVNKVIVELGSFVSKLWVTALRTTAVHGTLPIKPHLLWEPQVQYGSLSSSCSVYTGWALINETVSWVTVIVGSQP